MFTISDKNITIIDFINFDKKAVAIFVFMG